MPRRHDPGDAPAAQGGYTQGLEIATPGRLLHVSGQIPVDGSGSVPESFEDQCHLVWANLAAVLRSANMEFRDLVKVTTYLSDRRYRDINAEVRRSVLGAVVPALTVIIADIYEEAWLLEIDAVAFRAA